LPSQNQIMRTSLPLLLLLWATLSAWAQWADSADKSWTTTTDSTDAASGAQTRRTESHNQNGNRTVDTKSIQIFRSGRFEPLHDVVTETVKLNATTTRTTTRSFGRDSNGQKTLLQLTDEETQDLAGGGAKTVRTTSNPDLNGGLQLVQREVRDTRQISPDTTESKTTVFVPGVNGLSPAMQIQERQQRNGDTIEFQKSTLLPDSAGKWQAGEIKRGTIKDDGKNRTSEERSSRQNSNGELEEVSRTVTKESKTVSGETRSTVETFSTDVPGAAPDGRMHLVQRKTGTRSTGPNGKQTEQQQLDAVNPADPGAGLQVSVRSTEEQTTSASGTKATQTVQIRDPCGNMNVLSVDTTSSTKTPAIQVKIAPETKPK